MKVLNFGSLNLDYVYQVDHIIIPGETQATKSRNLYHDRRRNTVFFGRVIGQSKSSTVFD